MDLPSPFAADIRGLSPVQRHAEAILLLPNRFTDRLEKYSDWLSAGAGAGIIALVGRDDLSGTLGEYPQGFGLLLILASLFFGLCAKAFAYTATVFESAGRAGLGLAGELASSVSSHEEFRAALNEVDAGVRPRLRLLQRPLYAFVRSRPRTDPLTLATLVNASVQYLFTMIGLQLLSIVGGVVLLVLPALV